MYWYQVRGRWHDSLTHVLIVVERLWLVMDSWPYWILVLPFNMVIRPISIFFNLVLWFGRFCWFWPIFRHFYYSQYGGKSDERRKLSVGNMLRWFVCHASTTVLLSNTMATALPIGVAHETCLHLWPSHPLRNDKYLTSKSGKICWFFQKNRSKHKTKLKYQESIIFQPHLIRVLRNCTPRYRGSVTFH